MSSKTREALNQLLGLIDNGILVFSNELDPSEISNAQYQIDKAGEAYEKPLRNCDIGSADEQLKRFEDFCLKHIGCAKETGGRHCVGCPLEKASVNITQKCELYWAQMPYEKGENDD